MKIVCDFPIPPSVNDIWTPVAMPKKNRRAARLIKSKLYTEWENKAIHIAKAILKQPSTFAHAGGFGSARVRISLVYHFKGNRNDDINNREKAMSDLLEHAGWMDSDYQIDETHIYRGDILPEDPHVNVIMEAIE